MTGHSIPYAFCEKMLQTASRRPLIVRMLAASLAIDIRMSRAIVVGDYFSFLLIEIQPPSFGFIDEVLASTSRDESPARIKAPVPDQPSSQSHLLPEMKIKKLRFEPYEAPVNPYSTSALAAAVTKARDVSQPVRSVPLATNIVARLVCPFLFMVHLGRSNAWGEKQTTDSLKFRLR